MSRLPETIHTENVLVVAKEFYELNAGDDSTQEIILSMTAQILDVSVDTMLELIGE